MDRWVWASVLAWGVIVLAGGCGDDETAPPATTTGSDGGSGGDGGDGGDGFLTGGGGQGAGGASSGGGGAGGGSGGGGGTGGNTGGPCSLFESDTGCASSQGCYLNVPEMATKCLTPTGANAMEGEPCDLLNDCQSRQVCIQSGGDTVCRWTCDLVHWDDDPAPAVGSGGCPSGQSCGDVGAGVDDAGVCLP